MCLSSAHKEDISVLIDHLNNDSSFAQREITQFCQKHMLVGYEVLVAKRIIKLNQVRKTAIFTAEFYIHEF